MHYLSCAFASKFKSHHPFCAFSCDSHWRPTNLSCKKKNHTSRLPNWCRGWPAWSSQWLWLLNSLYFVEGNFQCLWKTLRGNSGQIQGQTQGLENIHLGEVQIPPSSPAEQVDIFFRKKKSNWFFLPKGKKKNHIHLCKYVDIPCQVK